MKVTKWITWKEADGKPERGLGGMGGFFQDGMRWADYLVVFVPEVHADLEELRTAIILHRIRYTGEQHQYGANAVPVWEDGTIDLYSYRAWGDLMAAVWSSEENRDYSYMDFYM